MSRPNANSQEPPISGKPSICFVSPNAYDAVSGRTVSGHIGGAEIQLAALARGLCDRGYPVSLVTWDEGQPDGIPHDGIRIFNMCSRTDGVPIVRFIHPRWTSLWAAMNRADADVYYQMNSGAETGQVSLWCRRQGRVFLFAISSDGDCNPKLPHLRHRREGLLYRHGLRHANRVIAQTETQARLMRKAFGIETALVRVCSQNPPHVLVSECPYSSSSEPRLLWVGRVAPVKRLELLLDLAVANPEIAFDVIGPIDSKTQYATQLRARAAVIENVCLHGPLPHDQVLEWYPQATALICTSSHEGFPSTFMEAWAVGIPIVSTVDPDGVISRFDLGGVAMDVLGLTACLRRLLASESEWLSCSQRAQAYFRMHHTVERTVHAFESMLSSLPATAARCPAITAQADGVH